MLQVMTEQTDKKKYPTLGARVPEEFKKKFEKLLEYIQIGCEQPLVDSPTLVRMLLSCDTRIPVDPKWHDYLSGRLPSLPEVKQKPPVSVGLQDGRNLRQNKRRR